MRSLFIALVLVCGIVAGCTAASQPSGSAIGINGLDGHNGRDGLNGEAGIPGERGEQGPIGLEGLPGLNGGRDGVNGEAGAPGPAGDAGPPGKTGDAGLNGEAGKDGIDNHIAKVWNCNAPLGVGALAPFTGVKLWYHAAQTTFGDVYARAEVDATVGAATYDESSTEFWAAADQNAANGYVSFWAPAAQGFWEFKLDRAGAGSMTATYTGGAMPVQFTAVVCTN